MGERGSPRELVIFRMDAAGAAVWIGLGAAGTVAHRTVSRVLVGEEARLSLNVARLRARFSSHANLVSDQRSPSILPGDLADDAAKIGRANYAAFAFTASMTFLHNVHIDVFHSP